MMPSIASFALPSRPLLMFLMNRLSAFELAFCSRLSSSSSRRTVSLTRVTASSQTGSSGTWGNEGLVAVLLTVVVLPTALALRSLLDDVGVAKKRDALYFGWCGKHHQTPARLQQTARKKYHAVIKPLWPTRPRGIGQKSRSAVLKSL
jgi:hypothetical protein